jgi:hypothetical protein
MIARADRGGTRLPPACCVRLLRVAIGAGAQWSPAEPAKGKHSTRRRVRPRRALSVCSCLSRPRAPLLSAWPPLLGCYSWRFLCARANAQRHLSFRRRLPGLGCPPWRGVSNYPSLLDPLLATAHHSCRAHSEGGTGARRLTRSGGGVAQLIHLSALRLSASSRRDSLLLTAVANAHWMCVCLCAVAPQLRDGRRSLGASFRGAARRLSALRVERMHRRHAGMRPCHVCRTRYVVETCASACLPCPTAALHHCQHTQRRAPALVPSQ